MNDFISKKPFGFSFTCPSSSTNPFCESFSSNIQNELLSKVIYTFVVQPTWFVFPQGHMEDWKQAAKWMELGCCGLLHSWV